MRQEVSGRGQRRPGARIHVERQNLAARMHMHRFTQLTEAFSKKVESQAYAVALHMIYYNSSASKRRSGSPQRWQQARPIGLGKSAISPSWLGDQQLDDHVLPRTGRAVIARRSYLRTGDGLSGRELGWRARLQAQFIMTFVLEPQAGNVNLLKASSRAFRCLLKTSSKSFRAASFGLIGGVGDIQLPNSSVKISLALLSGEFRRDRMLVPLSLSSFEKTSV
jgi:hypothetical protein